MTESEAVSWSHTVAAKSARQLVIEPPAVRLMHNTRGLVMEVFHPLGIETEIEQYHCDNPACNCPDDYYLDISIKISKEEYDRIRQEPGWVEGNHDDDDDCDD